MLNTPHTLFEQVLILSLMWRHPQQLLLTLKSELKDWHTDSLKWDHTHDDDR